jgi:hypothetical protein
MTIPDAQREQVIAHLRQMAGEGRLDMDEYGERLDEAYQAQTPEQLQHAVRELPPLPGPATQTATAPAPAPSLSPSPSTVPMPRAQPSPVHRPAPRISGHNHPHHPAHPKGPAVAKAAWGAHLGSYLSVNLMLVVIWLMTTPGGYFWPMWPIMGWGVGLVAHGMAHKAGGGGRDRRSPE